MTDKQEPGHQKQVIIKFALYFLAVVGAMLIARVISIGGYDYLGWFLGGAIIAFAMQMILVPREHRRRNRVLLAVIVTGMAGMLVNYVL